MNVFFDSLLSRKAHGRLFRAVVQ